MTKTTSTPRPQQLYKDAHGALVTIGSITHTRVTFYRDGYRSLCVQPLERFTKEFREVAQ
ncbi:DUF4222 domain-containing protein [Pectobacterium parmentieri]|uniref:DUF4222 domain-containing protein n=1 Tax=Pectobacterium parmentieri TaxID=1905730 RepID=A0A0H3I9N3_PECPM|nr:DUF4222 domain-containing protein [Pectobacterium parmentieri]AFI91631.1 Hypothetical protein W5S_3561 [Pectobacterium parmentieri]MBI0471249.1 DUF4222 domain-containing protein [Pectobacterium parmentieri]MBI0493861.1 DUF4222 domain-containing protein [Pectobacterium parmentieri]MBI0554717.1 DUF4222 domain-containing protein [Pectobacterium parmentieri]MBI0568127.1 DUF4222 domain-containing protein [Pectobacterium parmentieri]